MSLPFFFDMITHVMKFPSFRRLFSPLDLTKGNITKNILLFSFPIVLSLIFQQIYTMTDAAIVGQNLSPAEVAGVNNSSSLVFMVLQFGFGCASGFSVVIAEAIGRKDGKGVRRSFFVQIVLSFFIGAFLTGIGIALLPLLLGLLGISSQTGDLYMSSVYTSAYTYLSILFGGIVCQLFYNMIVAILRSLGDSFVPFLFLLGSTVLNAGLDLLFVLPLSMGVAGSALATIMSQGIAAVGALIYAWKRYPILRFGKEDVRVPWKEFAIHLKNGLPLGFQYSLLAIGMVVMQSSIIAFDILPEGGAMKESMSAQLGYGAACKIINFLMVPLNALGTAMLAFTGQNDGAGDGKRIRDGVKKATGIVGIFCLILLVIGGVSTINGAYQYIFLSPDKVSEETIAFGNVYLYLSIPALFFLGMLFLSRNILQGLQKPLWPFLAGIGELFARIVVCMFLPSIIAGGPINSESGPIPFIGAALGDAASWFIATIILVPPMIHALTHYSGSKGE